MADAMSGAKDLKPLNVTANPINLDESKEEEIKSNDDPNHATRTNSSGPTVVPKEKSTVEKIDETLEEAAGVMKPGNATDRAETNIGKSKLE
jgi:hypothetical protein